jgi:LysR family transcriptional regulator, carnitine catabolism transcriptional activator
MELRQVEYVLAVIDEGSFTAGAHALGIAQPSLSEGVRRLEDEFGAQLFERRGRRVVLTEAGHAFEGPARRLLREHAAVHDAVTKVVALETGMLDVVALPTLVVDPLARLVGRFRVAHPGVTVRIADPDDTAALEARVADGRSELGLTDLPTTRDDLVSVGLGTHELVAVCPPGTRLPKTKTLPIARIAELPLIAGPRGTSMRETVDRALATAGSGSVIVVETAHRDAIGPLVLSGAGASFVPRSTGDALAASGAVVARVQPALVRQIGIVHRANPLSPAARAFVELSRRD